jgi:hypothetical protein
MEDLKELEEFTLELLKLDNGSLKRDRITTGANATD